MIRQCRSRSLSRGERGPCICISGPHQRSSASWIAARCAVVPVAMVTTTSRPCMMWTDSSQQILRIVRAYGRVGRVAQRHLGHDRRRVDQPGDHPDVGPADGRVVEDVVELGLARRAGRRTSPRAACRGPRPRDTGAGRARPRPGPWRSGRACAAGSVRASATRARGGRPSARCWRASRRSAGPRSGTRRASSRSPRPCPRPTWASNRAYRSSCGRSSLKPGRPRSSGPRIGSRASGSVMAGLRGPRRGAGTDRCTGSGCSPRPSILRLA